MDGRCPTTETGPVRLARGNAGTPIASDMANFPRTHHAGMECVCPRHRFGWTGGVPPRKRDQSVRRKEMRGLQSLLTWRTIHGLTTRRGYPKRHMSAALHAMKRPANATLLTWRSSHGLTARRGHPKRHMSAALHRKSRTPQKQQAAGLHLPLARNHSIQTSTGLAATTKQSKKTKATKKRGRGLWDGGAKRKIGRIGCLITKKVL
jgi:hypothetical protein